MPPLAFTIAGALARAKSESSDHVQKSASLVIDHRLATFVAMWAMATYLSGAMLVSAVVLALFAFTFLM